jgi:hypothetical protein
VAAAANADRSSCHRWFKQPAVPGVQRKVIEMNPYALGSLGTDSAETASLRARLVAWHDAMVTHERRLKWEPAAPCGDECPHVEASALWHEASALLGPQASELTFLRSRALAATGGRTQEDRR